MPLLYGATERSLVLKMQRNPAKYGPGLDAPTLSVLFQETPVIEKLRLFLAVSEAVGAAAPAAGVTVVDPLDGAMFTWNPPKRRKVQDQLRRLQALLLPAHGPDQPEEAHQAHRAGTDPDA